MHEKLKMRSSVKDVFLNANSELKLYRACVTHCPTCSVNSGSRCTAGQVGPHHSVAARHGARGPARRTDGPSCARTRLMRRAQLTRPRAHRPALASLVHGQHCFLAQETLLFPGEGIQLHASQSCAPEGSYSCRVHSVIREVLPRKGSMLKAEDGPGGPGRAFPDDERLAEMQFERAPADSSDLNPQDPEQAIYPRSFETSADGPHLSKRAPWWSKWRTSGSWQKIATSEKEPSPQPRGSLGPGRGSKLLASVAGASVIVNLVLLMLLLVASGLWHVTSGGEIALLGSWAVDEASSVLAAESFICSGRGVRYADTIGEGCECDQCYQGLDCSELMSNCSVDLSR